MLNKYECEICGYIYDPEKGDKTQDVEAGTDFLSLPEDWICPMCEVDKTDFSVIS